MKRIIKLVFAAAAIFMVGTANAQEPANGDSTGLPGDNFSLQGALQMFQQSSSLEDFEKRINTQGNYVNNLDLNNDGETDYIRVVGQMDKDVHAIVLQVPVSELENQDIAVIEIEKTGDTTAILQIVGDEDIYGEQTIVEPDGGGDEDEAEEGKPGGGPYFDAAAGSQYRIVVNVWFWSPVRFVYAPVYRPWVSPWKWRAYPKWWRPWRPLAWHVYHPLRRHYHRPFVLVRTHRVLAAHRVYAPRRVVSVSVRTRNAAHVGNYRVTRSKTKVTGRRGNTFTKKTTTVRGPGGNVRGQKTTIKRKRG
jgi:hypothetical protein